MDFETVEPAQVPEDAFLVDIREQDEWDAGHAPGAHHLPASTLASNLDVFAEHDGAYLVCRSGGRSFQVAQWLSMNGFEVINVGGGMDGWLVQGLPIVADDGREPRII